MRCLPSPTIAYTNKNSRGQRNPRDVYSLPHGHDYSFDCGSMNQICQIQAYNSNSTLSKHMTTDPIPPTGYLVIQRKQVTPVSSELPR